MHDEVGTVGERQDEPLPERTVRRLGELIADGVHPPGSRLSHRELMVELGVSRATIRAALATLAGLGVIEFIAGHGAFVVDVSEDDARQLCTLRAEIQPLLVGRFVQRAAPEELALAAQAIRRFAGLAQEGAGIEQLREACEEVYEILLGSRVSWVLGKVVRTERLRLAIYTRRRLSAEDQLARLRRGARSLELLVPSILGRDGCAARRLCELSIAEDSAEMLRASARHALTSSAA